MTIQEFYTNIDGDYTDVLLRLPSDDLVIRFLKRFLEDKTFLDFKTAIENGDIKQSFETSHKLKGIAANLSFTKLYKLLCLLCEHLRSLEKTADTELVKQITDSYNKTIEQIKLL